MEKRDKITDFLLKPPMWLCAVVWAVGAAALGGSIVLYYLGLGLKLWALSVHLIALVFFVLSVYAVLTVIGVPARAKNSMSVQKFFKSYNVRAFVFAVCSVIFNALYVVFGIIIAVRGKSAWLFALVGYHVFLIAPRFTVLYFSKLRGGDSNDRTRQNVRAYAYCGLALILLAVALVPVIRIVALDGNTYDYFTSGIIYVVAIATYSFVKLGIALYNFKKVRGTDDLPLIAIKNVSLSDALISVFALQAMMLKVLPNDVDNIAVLNPVVGGILALGIFALGLYMLINGLKKLKAFPAVQTDKDNDNVSLEGEA